MAESRICGLSQEVTLAILPRLHLEELVLELGRRNIQTDGRTDNMAGLVGELRAVMMREYQGVVAKVTMEAQSSSQNASVTMENGGQNSQMKSITGQSYTQQGVVSEVVKIETQQQTEPQPVERFAGECESDNEYDPFAPEDHTAESIDCPVATTDKQDKSKISDDGMDFERTQSSVNTSGSLVQDMDMVLTEVQLTDLQARNAECEEKIEPIPTESTCTGTLDSTDDGTGQLEMSKDVETQRETNSTGDKTVRSEKKAPIRVTFQMKTLGKEELRLYKCAHCRYVTSQKLTFENHLSEKHKENATPSSEKKEQVQEKRQVTRRQKQFECEACDYVTSSKKCLVVHVRKHTGEKPYKCSECSYAGTSSSALIKHRSRHRQEKPHKCTQCDYAAAAKNSLQCHMGSKHGVFSFVCEVCGFRAATLGNLNRHMATHSGVRPFKCPHCDYAAAEKKTLTRHIRSKHTENRSKPFVCDQCPFRAQEKSDLTRHVKRHNKKKIHLCELCNFTSHTKCGLRTHQAEHKGGPVFFCDLCSYKTYQQHLLNRHNLARHTGGKTTNID